ncbi:MAG TPA: hypothetical protein VM243_04500 [Phycisphaerae bacterium]|nr:hypothetical protein [Phycisphaerae bacterium]
MTDRSCNRLDDYLGGWLEESVGAEFAAHLARCVACRAEIERQRRLDGLLGQAGAYLESVRPDLVCRIERRLVAARRQRWVNRAVAGLTAAAVLLLSVLLWPQALPTRPAGTIVGVPQKPRDSMPEKPPTASVGPRAASEQLAVLVVSQCGHSCPSAHRWTRMPRVALPMPSARAGAGGRVQAYDEAEAGPAQGLPEPPKFLVSSSWKGKSCIQARHTLGSRKVARIVFH